jgi:phage shock protein A
VASVYTARVLDRLLDIQRRAGKDDGSVVRALALDAQEDLLEIERQIVAALAQVHELNRRLEKCHQARHADLYQNEEVIR